MNSSINNKSFFKGLKNVAIFLMLFGISMLNVNMGFAQMGVSETAITPHASSILELKSTSKGFLAPRMTAAQRAAISSPATGLIVYQTDGTSGYYFYNGSAWTSLGQQITFSTGLTNSSGTVTVNTSQNISKLSNLTTNGIVTTSSSDGTLGVTSTLPVANGGTGVTSSTGSGNVVLSTSPTLVTPVLGTPASGVATNLTGLPLTTGVTGTLPIANGGTNATTKAAAFDNLSPMSASGDIIYGGASGTGTALAKGTNGQVLTLASGIPSWVTGTSGSLLNVQVFTSGTAQAYTPTQGATKAQIILVGGGGGGGNASLAKADKTGAIGGGGGSGTVLFAYLPLSTLSSYTYTVGGGGASYTDGGQTSFGGLIAPGGSKGTQMTTGAGGAFTRVAGGAGGVSATTINGGVYYTILGSPGGYGSMPKDPSQFVISGAGGSNPYGIGGASSYAGGTVDSYFDGFDGSGFGSGGSGAALVCGNIAAGSKSGGSGKGGIIIVYEYK